MAMPAPCLMRFPSLFLRLVFAWLMLLPWLVVPSVVSAQNTVLDAPQVDLLPLVAYLEDPLGRLTLDEVHALPSEQFKPLDHANLGYSSSTFWLRIPLSHGPDGNTERLLALNHFDINEVIFYAPGEAAVMTGLDYPLSDETWPHRHYIFPLTLSAETQYYYLQIRSQSAVIVPLSLWQPTAFIVESRKGELVQGMYHGALLVLVLYNLLIFLSLREPDFLFYSLFAGLMGLAMFALNGLMRQYLWPAELAWPSAIHLSLSPLTVAFALYFTQNFLRTRLALPKLHIAIHLVAAWAWLQAVTVWLGVPALTLATGFSLLSIVAGGLVLATGILAWRTGNHSARLFLLAWGVLGTGAIVSALHSFGLLPSNLFTSYAMQLSSGIEMVLLSFALAERIRLERNTREASQAEALDARQALVDSLRESEARLEKAVAVRTIELNQSLQIKRDLLDRYVRFGAQIAHEFRNPLAIIKSQLTLIDKEREHGRNHIERRLAVIGSASSRLGRLFEEWLQSDRMRQTEVALNLTTLPLAGWLKDVVDDCIDYHSAYIELEIQEPLPDLQADEAMLRSAIYNLVDNAAKYAPTGGAILVKAMMRDGMLGIAVIDQGPGIAPSYQTSIFDDYVRAVPEDHQGGLGLGLAFVKKIVELHRGWIELKSDPQEGTGFCLWLPSHRGIENA